MRALVVDPAAPGEVRLAEVAEPAAAPHQVLVEVHHVSLNYGDLNDARSGRVPPGAVLGSDAAGVVLRAGDRGPVPGSRVVALASGAFAERVVVDADSLAEVPSTVDLAQAAALPVAGVAALRALRAAGPLLGRRVLVTGASGGVGRFAVRLASIAGAHVIAAVGSAVRGEGLDKAGADEVVVGLGGIGPPKSLTSFLIDSVVAAELDTLVRLVEKGDLPVEVGWRGPLDRFAEAAGALRSRRVTGKAILDVIRT
jgi:NADPH2:quinone reductase